MEWKYYEHLKTLDFKYNEQTIREAISQISWDNNQKIIDKNFKWVNKTELKNDDYWILNQVMKNEKYNIKEIVAAYDRILKNKLKKTKQ